MMRCRFLLDEHVPWALLSAIQSHDAGSSLDPIACVRVGGAGGPPLGTPDPDLLVWAEREDYIFVANDRDSLIGFFAERLSAGRSSLGLFILPRRYQIAEIVEFFALAAEFGSPEDWRNLVTYVPRTR